MTEQSPLTNIKARYQRLGDFPPYVPPTLRPPLPHPFDRPADTIRSEQIKALLLDNSPQCPAWKTPPKTLRKMPKSSSLSLGKIPMRTKDKRDNPAISPRSPHSPQWDEMNEATPVAAVPPLESPTSPNHRKDSSRSFWSNLQASKSSPRINTPDDAARQMAEAQATATGGHIYGNGRAPGSTPDLHRAFEHRPDIGDTHSEVDVPRPRPNAGSIKSNSVPYIDNEANGSKHTNKPKMPGLLSRSRSIKTSEEDVTARLKKKANTPTNLPDTAANWNGNGEVGGLKTAPLEKEKSWRQNMSLGKMRNHSADHHDGPHSEDDRLPRRERADQTPLASSLESRTNFMQSIGSGARKMGEKMETARKGMFGKLGRSGSAHEKNAHAPMVPYEFKVIRLGLVEQTRKTRISKRLEASKDKTEFWMPALPWRCIDYLNMKGTEEEGLYRVPGSDREIKIWEQRFDKELDIDLFTAEDLYDINVIASLFKGWLRELPEEIFPKSIQDRIHAAHPGAKETPQMLKDELSKLPPYNYYLLFAITCHISLLHSCKDVNRMNFGAIRTCFQPSLKMHSNIFEFLILDWRNCWQGCWTEKEWLATELRTKNENKPNGSPQPTSRSGSVPRAASIPPKSANSNKEASYARGSQTDLRKDERGENRTISSSDSSKASMSTASMHYDHKGRPSPLAGDLALDDEDTNATPTQTRHTRLGSDNNSFRLEINQAPSSPFSIQFNQ